MNKKGQKINIFSKKKIDCVSVLTWLNRWRVDGPQSSLVRARMKLVAVASTRSGGLAPSVVLDAGHPLREMEARGGAKSPQMWTSQFEFLAGCVSVPEQLAQGD